MCEHRKRVQNNKKKIASAEDDGDGGIAVVVVVVEIFTSLKTKRSILKNMHYISGIERSECMMPVSLTACAHRMYINTVSCCLYQIMCASAMHIECYLCIHAYRSWVQVNVCTRATRTHRSSWCTWKGDRQIAVNAHKAQYIRICAYTHLPENVYHPICYTQGGRKRVLSACAIRKLFSVREAFCILDSLHKVYSSKQTNK